MPAKKSKNEDVAMLMVIRRDAKCLLEIQSGNVSLKGNVARCNHAVVYRELRMIDEIIEGIGKVNRVERVVYENNSGGGGSSNER